MRYLVLFFILGWGFFAGAAPTEAEVRERAWEVVDGQLGADVVSVLAKYRIITIGEIHGNGRSPMLAGDIAMALAVDDDVVLALEIQQANQFGLDEYRRTGNKRILRMLSHFAREYQDGRSSLAMVQLLERVRTNPRIEVLAFDPDFESSDQDRDTKMAQKILDELKASPNKKIVVLAGNLHSSIKVGNRFDPDKRPMGYELFSLPDSPVVKSEVLSIMTRFELGSAWVCWNDAPRDCGPRKLARDQSSYSKAVPYQSYFLVEPALSDEGYLATFFHRRIDASPPFRDSEIVPIHRLRGN